MEEREREREREREGEREGRTYCDGEMKYMRRELYNKNTVEVTEGFSDIASF